MLVHFSALVVWCTDFDMASVVPNCALPLLHLPEVGRQSILNHHYLFVCKITIKTVQTTVYRT